MQKAKKYKKRVTIQKSTKSTWDISVLPLGGYTQLEEFKKKELEVYLYGSIQLEEANL